MKNNKFICLVAVVFFMANIAYSSEYHKHTYNAVNTTIQPSKIELKGVASAIASSQHQFYYGTYAWQGSVGIGAYDATTAFSFGLAKRFNKALINGNVTEEKGKFGGGVGINWHF